MAFDIITGNWDGPLFNKNNFYLYHNQRTGMLEYIPYDLDNSFGIDWFNIDWAQRNIYSWGNTQEARPLFDKIIAVPEYRDRLSFYLNRIITDLYSPSHLAPYINGIRGRISSAAQADLYRTYDYGFTFSDFNNSFNTALGSHVKHGIKSYISDRYTSIQNQLSLNEIAPIITNVNNNRARLGEDFIISAKVVDEALAEEVLLHYRINGDSELSVTMNDDGANGDTLANDGIYTVTIDGLNDFGNLAYFVSAKDVNNQVSRYPSCQTFNINFSQNDIGLYINEFMASNDGGITDENGEDEDWIELYNASNNSIHLGDKYLSDDLSNTTKWQMPAIQLAPGQFILFWADNDTEQGLNHTNFKLSKGGEDIVIFDSDGRIIDFISYTEQSTNISTGRLPNGTGAFQSLEDSSPDASNNVTSLSELETLNYQLQITPNPSQGLLRIDFGKETKNPYQVALYNLMGQELKKLETFPKNKQIQQYRLPNDLSNGVYYISIRYGTRNIATNKIILLK